LSVSILPKAASLSTYGAWWIKQSIKRALANQSKTIRLPVHLVDKISKMRRTAMKLQEEFGREPTDEELGDELGMTAARVSQLRTAAIRPASLDAPIGDDDSNNLLKWSRMKMRKRLTNNSKTKP
jgi:RNA polymerase primary sigma factor